MEEKSPVVPFIIKPLRINNYTHLITLLKIKQKKYADYAYGQINHSFSDCLSSKEVVLNLDEVLEGYLHERLQIKLLEYEKNIEADFNKEIEKRIKDMKIDNDMRIHSLRIGDVSEMEELLFQKPSILTFKDEFLFDLYEFLFNKNEPADFLNNSYLKYIRKHFTDDKFKNIDFKSQVTEFVKMKFNKDEYSIEVYENRYLWAEMLIFLRVGRIDIVKELLDEHEVYFEFISKKFKSAFLLFLDGKKCATYPSASARDDKFKRFLFDLIEEKAKSDGLVISTVEDYLWMKLIENKEIKSDIDQFDSSKIRFMIAIFTKKYKKAIDILLRSDFGMVAKFFLLKELCFEQTLEAPVNTFDKTNRFQRNYSLRSKIIDDCSSTTSSYSLISSDMPASSMSTIFLNFLFTLISKLSKKEYKVKLVEMLKNHAEYYSVVPAYIVKYELFDFLGKKYSSNELDFALDDTIALKVLNILKENGNKRNLMKLWFLMDDVSFIQVLNQALEEAILIDDSIDTDIIDRYITKRNLRDCEKLINLYGLYKFDKAPSISTLRPCVIFNKNIDLMDYKFVIEKVFFKAVDVVKETSDKLMASTLFLLCGTLGLSEECTNKVSKDLVMLI